MAIAFDAVTSGTQTTATSKTLAHTVTGSNTVVFALIVFHTVSTDGVTGVTYNGNAMSQLTSYPITTGNLASKRIYIYGYANGTGSGSSANCIASYGASYSTSLDVISFSGAAQSGLPDSSANALTADNISSPQSRATTVVADDSFLLTFFAGFENPVMTGSTNTTVAAQPEGSRNIMYSTAAVAAGSRALTWTFTGNDTEGGSIISFAPAAAAGPTNMKTWDGLAKASIKTMDGLAIASVKTWNGLT